MDEEIIDVINVMLSSLCAHDVCNKDYQLLTKLYVSVATSIRSRRIKEKANF